MESWKEKREIGFLSTQVDFVFEKLTSKLNFVGLAYQDIGKDIVYRFIIEYSSLRDFDPKVIGLFLYEDFRKILFWLGLKLEKTHRVIIC